MANFDLNLPLDIPWRRIAVTRDMIDSQAGDRDFPLRWQSSISVFDYEPEEEYQNYDGMIVSYLKVSCSITGFQPRGDEVGLHHSAARVGSDRLDDGDYLIDPSRWNDTRVINAYKRAIDDYYGCYGAVLEVTVAPKTKQGKFPLEKYPFFIDFEPKKRELYEVVTETGEAMSRTLSGLNVRKGSTTTDSHEVLDIFGGANVEASYAGTGGGVGVQGQWGTRDLNQTEYVDMRSTDSAREKRETFSHTTQLSQMYHQLNSYHIGTNRALFYILPRPHIVQLSSDNPEETDRSTFVDGPRLLEGIQDFFLVVLRPKEMREICIEAYLETAHIFQEKLPQYLDADTMVEEFVVNGSLNEREGETERIENEDDAFDFLGRVGDAAGAGAIGWAFGGPIGAAIGALFGAAWDAAFGDELDKTTVTAITRTFSPSGTDLEFDLSRADQATAYPVGERKQYIGCELLRDTLTEDQVSALGVVYSQEFIENTFFIDTGRKRERGNARIRVEVPQRSSTPIYVNGEKALFLTGRGVSTCKPPGKGGFDKPTIVWENPEFGIGKVGSVSTTSVQMTRTEANELGADIKRQLRESATSSDRRPRGHVSFSESDFFSRYVGKVMQSSPGDRKLIEKLDGVDKDVRKKIKKSGLKITRNDVLQADLGVLAARLDLDMDQVLSLRRASLGLVSFEEAKKIGSNLPKPGSIRVPNLMSLTLSEADRMLSKYGLERGSKRIVDDDRPRGHIVEQDPKPGSDLPTGGRVNVSVASGCSVRIPDVVGKPLEVALSKLKRAGVKRLPVIVTESVEDSSHDGIVLDVDPAERDFLLPKDRVSLKVGAWQKTRGKTKAK